MAGRPTQVTAYTDGACLGNPGPGGWATILFVRDREKELSGGEAQTTNQRMELRAAVEALRALRRPCRVELFSDSAYLVNCFRDAWYERWLRNGWRTKSGKTVENRDLWEELLELTRKHDVRFRKVAGHSGNPWNERCDRLARDAAARVGSV